VKILYALQGTGNGHVSRARDLVPRFAKHADVDVLISGVASTIDLGFPVKYHKYGLAMVYNAKGGVSYWESLWRNKLITFIKDVWCLKVKEYDLVVVDFEPVTSYACMLKGVKALQISHQAAYWSDHSPRPQRRVLHWEWVLKYMSPAVYKIGFHFQPYDRFLLPPIIRGEVRNLVPRKGESILVYLPSYAGDELAAFFAQFPGQKFEIFTATTTQDHAQNITLHKPSVAPFLQMLSICKGVICGAGFETPAEALYLGKSLLVIPIKGQYEQACNAAALGLLGTPIVPILSMEYAHIIQQFIALEEELSIRFPDYADPLVQQIISNVENGLDYDDISSLQVW